MYEGFAEIYDELMANVRYEEWADFYVQMLNAYGVRGGRICECACGTGNLTLPLYRRGLHMTGVDISQDMLWIASQKARAAGAMITFVRQDMRKLRLHRPMDAVLATCDGVNYLLEDDDLTAFFRSAYETVRPGGGLFFDISTPWKLRNQLGNHILCDDTDHITYLWQNSFSEQTGIVSMHLCFFIKQPDGSYRRVDEEQKQKAHEAEHLTSLLQGAGFDRVMVYGGSMRAPREKDERWHFAAIRRIETDE